MTKNQTIKQFLKGTNNQCIVEITEDNNINIVFNSTYEDLKKNRKNLLLKTVLSYDVTDCYDEATKEDYIIISIMI